MNDVIDATTPSPWMTASAPDRDVVLSSRVRFARNLDDRPFRSQASPDERAQLREDVHDVLVQDDLDVDWQADYVDEVEDDHLRLLVERRLASEELLQDPYGGLFYGEEESTAVMVNEEDHLRIQAFAPGSRVDDAFSEARRIERFLDEHLPFAYDDQWGFLTSCPTNVGTGLRASVLLHLPALVHTQKIERVLKAVSNLGLTVRGVAGEGSESRGFYFQLSNQVTLGQTAEEMRDNLKRVTNQIVEQERTARASVDDNRSLAVTDQIWRSYGILTHAQQMKTTEALETLSYTRFGADLGYIRDCSLETIDGLMLLIQPAHLSSREGDDLSSDERDFVRARLLRESVGDSDPTAGDQGTDTDPSGSESRSRET